MPIPAPRLPQRIVVTLLTFCLLTSTAAGAAERIVAIGDIHGAYDELVEILQTAKLIDGGLDWAGGKSRLVQTGDFTDRGSGVRSAIELLMKIERQAPRQGGEVHVLLGNHEVMNLILNDRDAVVNPEIFASFADAGSVARREKALEAWMKWSKRRQRTQERILELLEEPLEVPLEVTEFIEQDRESWLAAHPPGLFEYREALSADGTYGRWLRQLPVVLKLDDTLFLHGGIGPDFQDRSIEEVNQLHWRRLEEFADDRKQLEKRRLVLPWFSWEETRLALLHQMYFSNTLDDRTLAAEVWERLNGLLADLFSEGSPLWYRGYASPPTGLDDEALAALLDHTDAAFGVRRTVAAHTPLSDHSILNRLDGRLFLIDTGMLTSHYGGRPSALEISMAGASPVYATPEIRATSLGTNGSHAPEEATLEPATAAAQRLFYGPDGSPLPFQEREEIERFLLEATVLSKEPIGQGKTGAERVELERNGVRARAIFHTIDDRRGSPTRPVVLGDGTKLMFFRDSYTGQVAAYELSKLLGMDNVPPAVVRKIAGRKGSLALWIEDGINLFGWRERGEGDPTDARLYRQMHDMRIFDNLIHNTDRNTQNIFWTGDFVVWLIDHTRTLTQDRHLNRPDRVSRCSRPMLDALRRLDADQVRERLAPYISVYEIKALLKRRDKILEILDQRIREHGEDKVVFDGDDPVMVTSEPIE